MLPVTSNQLIYEKQNDHYYWTFYVVSSVYAIFFHATSAGKRYCLCFYIYYIYY